MCSSDLTGIKVAAYFITRDKKGPDCRKTYITKRVVRPTPINPQKAATCAWLFALLKGGAPRWSGGRTAILSLVRCPDGHTFFAFLRTTGPARERSMGAEALRQPLAKTRKSGLGHFFEFLQGAGGVPPPPYCAPAPGRLYAEKQRKYGRPDTGPKKVWPPGHRTSGAPRP